MGENTPVLARSVFVLHGHRLHRNIVIALIASVAILKFDIFSETVNEDRLDLKYGAYRIITGGATVQSVSSSSSCGHEVYPFIPRSNEENATLKSFDQRLKLFVSSTKKDEKYMCGPRLLSLRLTQKETHFDMYEAT